MVELLEEHGTEAEKRADKSRKVAGFKNLSLPGLKEKVAQLLSMIGSVDGIFSTYTKHDISHVDTMLEMLEWLVPPVTKKAMTPIDWLMIVLSIYLHDLGMLVTREEFEQRMDNSNFKHFLEGIKTDPDAKDYLDRSESMTEEERERFFYQEYVRSRHAARIQEWITGHHSVEWGDQVKPIAVEVAQMMADLPSRFRQNLGTVCKSHHDDNLDKPELFPLCEKYGAPQAVVNVQYAALLLRTTDLLHITRDRTPSVMYKLLRISDPKGIEEWAKHSDTFSVNMKPREFDPNDTESHVVVVKADLTEERPFFSLTEYVAYADDQIKQSKRWADKSQQHPDAKNFSLPWHTVEGNILVEGNEPQKMKFELDRGRLLDLLVGHTIYNEPTVAIRELLQNGIDAVRFQHHLDKRSATASRSSPPPMGRVTVRWNAKERLLAVEDNGIGMDLDTIRFHLMLVGASYYNTPQFHAEHTDFSPISRFGIGVLTCFMMSDDIEIVTCRGSEAHRIRMSSVRGDYLLKKLESGDALLKGLAPHGTRVSVRLRKSIDLEQQTVLDIVRHWVILPECPVIYQEDGADDVQVGYKTIKDALQAYYPEELNKGGYLENPAEVIRERRQDKSEHYELGLLTRRIYSSERGFVRGKVVGTPAVCVEGIRVDNRIPGFQADSLCAILSVRGNRRFRTTVSRMELERDEEYWRIAGICDDLFFEHIRKEVASIATKPGNPYSLASSAARFLTNSLIGAAADQRVRTSLQSHGRKLPSLVIEEIAMVNGKVSTSRKMINRIQLEDLPQFWTIESRIVDNLGIISRDLGREVSFNEFLTALAPERCDTKITPLLLDANLMNDPLLGTHKIGVAEFNVGRQESRIRWEPCQSWRAWWRSWHRRDSPPFDTDQYQNWIEGMVRRERELEWIALSAAQLVLLGDIELAPIAGDRKRVIMVHTRVAHILDAKSTAGRFIAATRHALQEAVSERAPEHVQFGIILALSAVHKFWEAWARLQSNRELHETFSRVCNLVLRESPDMLRNVIGTDGFEPMLDELKTGAEIFNVASYWRDWTKG